MLLSSSKLIMAHSSCKQAQARYIQTHSWANLAMQARARKEDAMAQNREEMDGEAVGEQKWGLGK